MKKLIWLWKCFWGRKYKIIYIEKGLLENEVLFYGHKIYVGKEKENGKICRNRRLRGKKKVGQ